MHAFNSHGATDVTGFGILGHAQNLAKQQENDVTFIIHNLPILNKMASIAKACGNMFGLLEGTSAETSGIFVMMGTVLFAKLSYFYAYIRFKLS